MLASIPPTLKRILPAVLGWFVFVAPCSSAPADVEPVLVRAHRTVTAPPRVLALYYGWYGTPQVSKSWSHYQDVRVAEKKIGSHVNFPAQGPYDSTDPQVLERHVQQAKTAGVETLVCSWWGKNDLTDRSFRALLPIAARQGLTLCPLYERVPDANVAQSVVREWRYLLSEYGRSPGWLKVDGKPVFFLFGRVRSQLAPEQWAEALTRLEREAPPGAIAIIDGAEFQDALVFDGMFTFDPRGSYRGQDLSAVPGIFQAVHRPILERAARFHRIPVLTVVPSREETERRDVAFYRLQWQEAAQQKKAWIFVNSFNFWHVGTEIEPSAEYGDLYLKTTATMAAEFKRPPPRVIIGK
jgi:glycoprotein endo-alpha-1,2-mannosidase